MTTVHFKCIIKSEVAIFLSFRKNKETKCISMEISKKFKRAVVSLSKACRSKYICDVAELRKNPRNPL